MKTAIFELVGLLFALPLSYIIAHYARKHSSMTYKDELNRIFLSYWDGEPENELYAWLKVKQLFSKRKIDKQRARYIQTKIRELNKTSIYGSTQIDHLGQLDTNSSMLVRSESDPN